MRFERHNPTRKRAGFTLMEMMIVVAIILITAGLAAPAIGAAMGERRATEAQIGFVRIGALGRSEAMSYGRAHLLRYSDASSGGNDGRVELWRGRVSVCSANDWPSIITGLCNSKPDCIDALDMGSFAIGSHRVQMRVPGSGTIDFCFQPDGDMYVSIDGGVWTATPPSGTDAVRVRFDHLSSGSVTGVERWVAVPFGAPPRMLL